MGAEGRRGGAPRGPPRRSVHRVPPVRGTAARTARTCTAVAAARGCERGVGERDSGTKKERQAGRRDTGQAHVPGRAVLVHHGRPVCGEFVFPCRSQPPGSGARPPLHRRAGSGASRWMGLLPASSPSRFGLAAAPRGTAGAAASGSAVLGLTVGKCGTQDAFRAARAGLVTGSVHGLVAAAQEGCIVEPNLRFDSI